MLTIALSEAAVFALRFRVKGLKTPVTDRNVAAFRELAAAGIMEPVVGPDGAPEADFRFTAESLRRRDEILGEAESHLRSLQPRLPERIELSEAARELIKRRASGESVAVSSDNLETYRELTRAKIMYPVSGFIGGPESHFRFTDQGWDRRDEWIAPPTESL